jgi:hypothetical protein
MVSSFWFCWKSDLMPNMGAREGNLNLNVFLLKYCLGLWSWGAGLFLFNRQHPYVTGLTCFGFLVLGAFFLSVARVLPEKNELKYRRGFRWHAVSYSEIRECSESWVFGSVKLRHYLFPWGRIYFARPSAPDSLFGLDKEVISTIRSRAHI